MVHRKSRGLSLRAKWSLALLVTGALPLALLTVITTRIQKRGLERSERELEAAVIGHVALIVDRTLDDAEEANHRVSSVLFDSRVADNDAKVHLAREAMARAAALAEVSIYKGDGAYVDSIRFKAEGASLVDPEAPLPAALVASESTSGQWMPVDYSGRGALLRFAEPVARDGKRIAWIVATLQPDAIDSGLKALSRDRFDGRTDSVLLLDREARVLAGGSSALPTGSSLQGKDIFKGRPMPSDMFDKHFVLATEYVAENGEEMVGFAEVLPARRWAVVVRRPASAVYGALHEARNWLAIAAAGFALFVMVIGAWIAARTTRPVRALVELSKAYARREFETPSTVHTGDELEGLGDSMVEMATSIASGEAEIARRARIQVGLSRYLPAEVAKAIAEGKRTLTLGGERRSITVLFADVVSFTPFAEQSSPERVVAFLNELFTILTEVVFRHEGTVDKFMGDCVMAIFGAPSDQPDHAARAIAAAEDMHRFVEANGPAWKATFGVEVRLAIGISSGDALVGNLGSDLRMEYTAIGDVVNVAARLEGLAQAGQTLVTAEVVAAAGDGFTFAELGVHPLRGKKQPVQILELT